MNKILVTGATGFLGSAVIDTLMKTIPSSQINVITRKKEKQLDFQSKGFNAFIGSYNDIQSLEKAMQGVDTVLLISSGDQGDRMQEHRNVVDAAKKIGVECIAYTSRSLRDKATLSNKLMTEHFLTEDYIKESGLTYTIFQNALYMDVVPLYVGKQVFETGIFQPAGDGKVAYALRKEQGEAIANVLLNEVCDNQVYKFTGSEAYSFYDIASVLSALSGKEVNYTNVEVPAYKSIMKERGVPEPWIEKLVDFNIDIKSGQEAEVTNELETKLGRKPATLKEGLKVLFGL